MRIMVVAAAVLCTWASCAGCAEVNVGPITVWATGDSVRVSPVTGKYVEDRTDIHKDYPTGDYRKRNAVWDAAKDRVTLHAARNEFVAFQVVVEAGEPARGVTVRLDELTGPGGVKLSGKNVALMKAWYVIVRKPSSGYQKTSLGKGWYADALLPAGDDGTVTLNIPEPTNHIGPAQKNHSVFVDIFIPKDAKQAPAGEYTGTLVVSGAGVERRIAIALNVWDFALPDEIHCRGDIWNGSMKRFSPDMELRYYQMAHRHRFHPGVAGYAPKVKVTGTKVAIDWAEYDKRLAKYFSGEAFTDKHGYWGPGANTPIPHIQLPFNCNKKGRKSGWPIAMENRKLDADGEAVWLETCRQFKEHFDADPTWKKVRKVVFLGGLDESYYQEAYDAMIYFSKLTRKGLGKDWYQFRIDGGYNSPAMRQLYPYVDLWVCHSAGWHQPKMLNFRGKGVETWFYGPMVYERQANSGCGSNTFTDLDLMVNRGIGWTAWKHRSGYCQFEFDFWMWRTTRKNRPRKPFGKAWIEAQNCSYGSASRPQEFNGSGQLIYRGELIGKPGHPIPTIRLKSQRRGMQDYEYFWLLKQAGKGADADKIVDEVITVRPFGQENYRNPNIWSHDPEAWDTGRIRAGEALHKLATK